MSPPVVNAPCPCRPLPQPTKQNRGVTALIHIPRSAPSALYQPDTGHNVMCALNEASTPPHCQPQEAPGKTGGPLPIRKSLTRVLTASITYVLHACRPDQIRNPSRNKQLGPISRAPSLFFPPSLPMSSIPLPSSSPFPPGTTLRHTSGGPCPFQPRLSAVCTPFSQHWHATACGH